MIEIRRRISIPVDAWAAGGRVGGQRAQVELPVAADLAAQGFEVVAAGERPHGG
jgi:hypothetical protein